MESYYLGDSTICWSFGNVIDRDLNLKVLYIYKELKESIIIKNLNILDIVPSYTAIAVYFDPLKSNPEEIKIFINKFIENLTLNYEKIDNIEHKEIVIPVIYDGVDLKRVAQIHNLTEEKVIELHSEPLYQVAMIGFKPHFPYLIGLNPRLETPRLNNPRIKIPQGSVAIGGAQTGIYPTVSPGGWNIIGRTNPELLKSIKPGYLLRMKRSDKL